MAEKLELEQQQPIADEEVQLGIPISAPVRASPPGFLTSFEELLKEPEHIVARARHGTAASSPARLVIGAMLCVGLYGASAGFFQGGLQILLASLKAPLIVAFSVLLCLPSLYIFSSLAGADLSLRRFVSAVAGFCGMLGILLVALLPISWLFSVSTSSLGFAVFLHVGAWLVALYFARRFLSLALDGKLGGVLTLWTLLFAITSFQVTTYLRPVLSRSDSETFFGTGKMFFLEHAFGDGEDAQKTASAQRSHPARPPDNQGPKQVAPAAASSTPIQSSDTAASSAPPRSAERAGDVPFSEANAPAAAHSEAPTPATGAVSTGASAAATR